MCVPTLLNQSLWESKHAALQQMRLLKGLSTAVMFGQVCISQSVMSALCKRAQAAVTQELSIAQPLLYT